MEVRGRGSPEVRGRGRAGPRVLQEVLVSLLLIRDRFCAAATGFDCVCFEVQESVAIFCATPFLLATAVLRWMVLDRMISLFRWMILDESRRFLRELDEERRFVGTVWTRNEKNRPFAMTEDDFNDENDYIFARKTRTNLFNTIYWGIHHPLLSLV